MQDRFVKRYENFSQNLYLFSPATAVFPLTYRHLWTKIQFNPGTGLYGRRKDTIIIYPGVAQLVARLLWEQDAASSSLATWTKRWEWLLPFPSFALRGRDSKN